MSHGQANDQLSGVLHKPVSPSHVVKEKVHHHHHHHHHLIFLLLLHYHHLRVSGLCPCPLSPGQSSTTVPVRPLRVARWATRRRPARGALARRRWVGPEGPVSGAKDVGRGGSHLRRQSSMSQSPNNQGQSILYTLYIYLVQAPNIHL